MRGVRCNGTAGPALPPQRQRDPPVCRDRATSVNVRCDVRPGGRGGSHGDGQHSGWPIIQPCFAGKSVETGPVKTRIQAFELPLAQEVGSTREPVPTKAELVVVRTDGNSCCREAVNGSGTMLFETTTTQQHLLVWKTKPARAMVIKKVGEDLMDEFLEVLDVLGREQNMDVVVEPDMYWRVMETGADVGHVYTIAGDQQDRLGEFIDFVVCLGGDGVILHASHLFKQSIPPVISFHLGSLGFLTNHEIGDLRKALQNVIYGCADTSPCRIPDSFSSGILITLRMRLRCEVLRQGEVQPVQTFDVINEVVLDRGSSPYLTNIECYERGRLIARVQADGVMLATPTGSTAYSVAAGGSMIHPNVPAILLTPICPHSLTFRPVVLPDYAEIELKVPECARSTCWVSFDGRERQELHSGDSVRVRMSQHPLPTITKQDQTADWFRSLERCFGWSERVNQKRFPSKHEE